MKHSLLLLILLLSIVQTPFAGNSSYETNDTIYSKKVIKSTIHTVQMHPVGWELAYPIMELDGENKLELNFDEFGEEIQDYSYRLIHCNADWTPSGLSEFDYLEGFAENQIRDYEHSFNTNIPYVHYWVVLPNEDIKPKLSGNYIIEVYQDFDPEKVVLTQRFMVVEPRVGIRGEVKHSINLAMRETHQEIDFSIFHENFPIENPQLDLKVILTQNNRWDGSQREMKPLFIRQNELVFDYDRENLFPGGNEFRYFDIKSLRYQSRFIKSVTKREGEYFVELFPGVNRHFSSYIYEKDLNGKFLIDVQERDDPGTEADYAWVTFTLPMETPMLNGKFYVYGDLSQWSCSEENAMKYNFAIKAYEATLLLKQGYYNYLYAFLENGKEVPDLTLMEGSHRETENDYVIYVYYHDIAKNYDRLIGWQTLNTLKQIY